MELALFDFDGTISKRDSFIDFIIFAIGLRRFIISSVFLSPVIVLYKLHIISNSKAKEVTFSHFFKGWNISQFEDVASRYSKEKLPRLIKASALKKLLWHKEKGHIVVIVSASMEHWLKDWCAMLNFDLIATKCQYNEGKVTGKFLTKNCYGHEKVRRIKEKYSLAHFEHIYAYGDSQGDKEMRQLADDDCYKNFV